MLMLCRDCDAEAVRGKDYCEECAGKANCPGCGAEMTGVDRNRPFGVEPCAECQQRERKEYAVRLLALWHGEARPDDRESYRFPVPPARFREAVPESIPKDLLKRLVRVMVDGEMGALLGPVGTGKTWACWALIFAVVVRNPKVVFRFIDWSDLCVLATECEVFGERGAVALEQFERLAVCQLLVIDEFGTSKPRENQFHRIYGLINRRYSECRATLVTTTMSLGELEEKMGEATVSRFRGGGVIEMNGRDRRAGAEV
jgi:DNA replication protein DnaC